MIKGVRFLHEAGEVLQGHPGAGLVVGGRDAVGHPLVEQVTSVPSAASASVVVIVISPARPGSADSNSNTSVTCSSGTRRVKRPW